MTKEVLGVVAGDENANYKYGKEATVDIPLIEGTEATGKVAGYLSSNIDDEV